MLCSFRGIEGKRLILESQESAPLFTAVGVECNDTLFLGEIIRSVPTADGLFRTEVKVAQILTGLQSLMNLRSHLLSEGVGKAPERNLARVYA